MRKTQLIIMAFAMNAHAGGSSQFTSNHFPTLPPVAAPVVDSADTVEAQLLGGIMRFDPRYEMRKPMADVGLMRLTPVTQALDAMPALADASSEAASAGSSEVEAALLGAASRRDPDTAVAAPRLEPNAATGLKPSGLRANASSRLNAVAMALMPAMAAAPAAVNSGAPTPAMLARWLLVGILAGWTAAAFFHRTLKQRSEKTQAMAATTMIVVIPSLFLALAGLISGAGPRGAALIGIAGLAAFLLLMELWQRFLGRPTGAIEAIASYILFNAAMYVAAVAATRLIH